MGRHDVNFQMFKKQRIICLCIYLSPGTWDLMLCIFGVFGVSPGFPRISGSGGRESWEIGVRRAGIGKNSLESGPGDPESLKSDEIQLPSDEICRRLYVGMSVCPSYVSGNSGSGGMELWFVCLYVLVSVCCLSVCPSVRLSDGPYVRMCVCPSFRMSVCPYVRLTCAV